MPSKKEIITDEKPLWLTGNGYTVVVSKDAEALKKKLIKDASVITQVTDTQEAEQAKAQRDDINNVLIDVEKTRKLVKQPVLDKGKEIDQTASNFTHDLTVEKLRLDKLIGDFAMEQEKIRREAAERAAREAAEAQRIQREAEEAEARAERLRLGAEQAAAEAENRKQRQAAEAAAQLAAEEARKAQQLSAQSASHGMQAHHASVAVMDAAKPRGTSIVIDYVVTNEHLLYRAAPHLVELTPKRRDILQFLNSQKEQGLVPALPGLQVTQRASIR